MLASGAKHVLDVYGNAEYGRGVICLIRSLERFGLGNGPANCALWDKKGGWIAFTNSEYVWNPNTPGTMVFLCVRQEMILLGKRRIITRANLECPFCLDICNSGDERLFIMQLNRHQMGRRR